MEPSSVLSVLSGIEKQGLDDPSRSLRTDPVLRALLDAFPEPVILLNQDRRIVAVNRCLQLAIGGEERRALGERMGEVMHCLHVINGPEECGIASACKFCGAMTAVAQCQLNGSTQTAEFLLSVVEANGKERAHEFRAIASPLRLDQPYTVLVLQDVSDERRRSALERIFYHDLLNTASAICGLLELWDEADSILELRGTLIRLALNVREQVESARDLAAAESGQLHVNFRPVDAARVIGRILTTYELLPMSHGRTLRHSISGSTMIVTDETLLHRVLENLVKNALEASSSGETIMLSFTNHRRPAFSVCNPGVIPPHARDWIFYRSFSTKRGAGHGIGLYSVKLITEQYLEGAASFTSSAETGTIFTVTLPDKR